MAPNGGKRVTISESVTKSVVITCRSQQQKAGAASSIGVLLARESFPASAEFVASWRVWLVVAPILAADSISGFGCALSVRARSKPREAAALQRV
jgi:hypothetical protein